LNAAKEQHKDLCNILQGASITLRIILLGVGGTIYNTHTLKPFKELGLDSQRVKLLNLRSLPPSSMWGLQGGYKDGLQPESLADGNWLVKQNQPVSKIETKSDTNLRSLNES
jgi:hypothetical protein